CLRANDNSGTRCLPLRRGLQAVWRIPQSLPWMVYGQTFRGRSIGMTVRSGRCGARAG
ncbi:MAG: hypothetical protein AVDCRST_MAG89-435, partial [uncultured Gemmatimonadetes bacterium]